MSCFPVFITQSMLWIWPITIQPMVRKLSSEWATRKLRIPAFAKASILKVSCNQRFRLWKVYFRGPQKLCSNFNAISTKNYDKESITISSLWKSSYFILENKLKSVSKNKSNSIKYSTWQKRLLLLYSLKQNVKIGLHARMWKFKGNEFGAKPLAWLGSTR